MSEPSNCTVRHPSFTMHLIPYRDCCSSIKLSEVIFDMIPPFSSGAQTIFEIRSTIDFFIIHYHIHLVCLLLAYSTFVVFVNLATIQFDSRRRKNSQIELYKHNVLPLADVTHPALTWV